MLVERAVGGARFLNYLEAHGIGMIAYAGDVMHHTMADWKYDPTDCSGGSIGGSGQQTMTWFPGLASQNGRNR